MKFKILCIQSMLSATFTGNIFPLIFSETYMRRCIELARLGAGSVAPNPMVGAVLVHQGRIIGEGFHRRYGQAHAEVNCINAVAEKDRHLLSQSTLYVSLEPCAHFGKTPPCADLVIEKDIPRVVIGCRDPFAQVNGRGIERLEVAGVEVTTGVLEKECTSLNKRFFTFHTQLRPYIILKWAQTVNGVMGSEDHSRLLITNHLSNRLVHRWRSEEAAILVGANTALYDNPELTNRLWSGTSPVRLVIDPDLRLPGSLKLFEGPVKTVVFNTVKQEEKNNLLYYRLAKEMNLIPQVLQTLYDMNIQSVLVEGGQRLLQSFIDTHSWDEARVITNTVLQSAKGIRSPGLPQHTPVQSVQLLSDLVQTYHPNPFSN
jgi:diaminohydroxyphosphoribosylaminopyrimidine deaminase/5-amino-6-(5-phosphoribosylamino)uracil reductase